VITVEVTRPHHRHRDRYSHAMDRGSVEAIALLEAAFERGDGDALEAAYECHGSLIYTFCCRSLGADLARDITQEIFLAAWRAQGLYRCEKGSLAGWLMGIAKNKIIDQHRRNTRRISTVGGADVNDLASVSEDTGAMADRMLLDEAIEALPERARNVVELAFYHELTHAEIAERTQLPLGTIKSDIRRGLARMRRHFEEVES